MRRESETWRRFGGTGEDEDGIKGFLPKDILKEWRRGGRLKCSYCDKNQATVGCYYGKCNKKYHLSCGIRNGSHQEFCGSFKSYCSEHRPEQRVYHSKEKDTFTQSRECGMCFETIKAIKNVNTKMRRKHLWSPCCNKWFHFDCVQTMAMNAGYFFKCPMCNDKDEFEEEMKLFGIYIPEQDAAWEREGNIFDGIYERHGTCDADECSCPDGRGFDEDYTLWEIILCKYCGSQGTHVKCGNLPLIDEVKWKCPACHEIVKKLPPRTKHHFRKINRNKKSSKRGVLAKILATTNIKISGSAEADVAMASRVIKASVQVCPKYDVPKPVTLGPSLAHQKDVVMQTFEKIIQDNITLNPILQLSPLKPHKSPLKHYTPKPAIPGDSPIKITPRKHHGVKRKLELDQDVEEVVVKHNKALLDEQFAKKKQKSILSYFGAIDQQVQ